MAGTRVKCDDPTSGCGRTFTAVAIEERLPQGGAEAYFTCPRCRHRYVMFRITPKGLAYRDRLRATTDAAEQARIRELLKAEVTRPA